MLRVPQALPTGMGAQERGSSEQAEASLACGEPRAETETAVEVGSHEARRRAGARSGSRMGIRRMTKVETFGTALAVCESICFAEARETRSLAIPRQSVTVGGDLRAGEKETPPVGEGANPWWDLCA
jgi:hypothetical protein